MSDLYGPTMLPKDVADVLNTEPSFKRVWALPSGRDLRLEDLKALAKAYAALERRCKSFEEGVRRLLDDRS